MIVGARCGGGAHKADALARKGTDEVLVSLKWQQTGGTAEQKVPFEVMCLADAVRGGKAVRAYLVLGGDGWTLRDYYTSGDLAEHVIHAASFALSPWKRSLGWQTTANFESEKHS